MSSTVTSVAVGDIYTRRFWFDTIERVVRTTAQVALAMFAVPALGEVTVGADDAAAMIGLSWQEKLTFIGATALLTLLTCLAGRTTGDTSTASLSSGTPPAVIETTAATTRPGGR